MRSTDDHIRTDDAAYMNKVESLGKIIITKEGEIPTPILEIRKMISHDRQDHSTVSGRILEKPGTKASGTKRQQT